MRVATIAAALMVIAPPAWADTLLVGNKGEDTVSFVDLDSGAETRRVPTARMPHEIALSPDGAQAAVVAYGGRTIELFDVAAARHLRSIDLGEGTRPHGLIWLRDGRMLATAEGRDALVVVAADGKVTQIPTGQQGTHMVAADAAGTRAWVANMKSGSVSEIDLAAGRKLRDIAIGKEPEGLALTPDGKTLWVADRGGDMLHVIDTATGREIAKMPTGRVPIRVAISPDGQTAYVSHFGEGSIGVFDVAARRPLRTIAVGAPANQQVTILLSPDGRRLYAAETGIDRVAEVDLATGKVLRRLPAGRQGDGLAIAPTVPSKGK